MLAHQIYVLIANATSGRDGPKLIPFQRMYATAAAWMGLGADDEAEGIESAWQDIFSGGENGTE